ncbi:MAG: hypothetical protein K5984_04825 [Bacteroidales bacterium]|nr:hypothetical protein [Bacteroidales bacterium]
MKKIFFLLSAAVLGLVSCSEETIDPLEGIYTAPITSTLTTLSNSEAYKSDGTRYFVLDLTDGTNTLHATLVGSTYYLTANTYTVAESASAKNGNYVYGETTVNGSNASSGSIIVTQDEDAYTLSALLFTEDDSVYKLSWEGTITYEGDPEATALTQVFTANSNVANGTNSVTLKLATSDLAYSFDMTTYTESYTGSGNFLALDLYSADGYLHEGTYTPCTTGGTIGEGEYGIGYDTEMWGMTFTNWGTCWWTVEDGVTSAEKITSGSITVSRSGDEWTITYGTEGDDIWCSFTGEIEALTSDEASSTSLTKFLSMTDYSAFGMSMIGLELATDGVSMTPADWVTSFSNTYSGTGNYLKLEVYSSDGSLAAGTYTACTTGGTINSGEFGIGYTGTYGASGTTWYTVTDGDTSVYSYVTDGTLTVSVSDGTYTIKLESTTINATYTGTLSSN